jgi:hypothetical protein
MVTKGRLLVVQSRFKVLISSYKIDKGRMVTLRRFPVAQSHFKVCDFFPQNK